MTAPGGARAPQIAVKVHCGARNGRCGRLLVVATTNPGRRPVDPLLCLATVHGLLMEDAVPPDFAGATGIVRCPEHSRRKTATGWENGVVVTMPFELLRPAFERFIATGKVSSVAFHP